VLKRRSGVDSPEFSGHTTMPECKHRSLQKDQFTTRASSSGIPPEEKKTLRDDETDTRDAEFGS
jgi:hypothetical protein